MPTRHDDLVSLIAALSGAEQSFIDKARTVVEFIDALPLQALLELLSEAGFIPEAYDHDSSEEKVYAKAMDALAASALRWMGYEAQATDERANAADVIARCKGDPGNSIVLDAKAFRLSRTALNPKDYKIEALSTWRKGERYACLVGPIAGFPEGKSRLYDESVRFDVTLLTFSHLRFLLERGVSKCADLRPIWEAPLALAEGSAPGLTAAAYWPVVDAAVCGAAAVKLTVWRESRRGYLDALLRVADQQIEYVEGQRQVLAELPKAALLAIAIEALKLDAKIEQIASKRTKARILLQELDRAENPSLEEG